MSELSTGSYGLSEVEAQREVIAPELAWLPPRPETRRHGIGVIGCGGIAGEQVKAYHRDGYRVVALCDLDESRAQSLRDLYYPEAFVTTDYRELLEREDVTVVDLATHPVERVALIEASIGAGKHILSQKPFVLDLDLGERLCDQADAAGVKLAVNQNGRWAPHYSYLLAATRAGIFGQIQSVVFTQHWDHTWTIGTPFEAIRHLILYDYGIHWFDLAAQFFAGRTPLRVSAIVTRSITQAARPPFLAAATIEFDGGLATLNFNANVRYGQEDRTFVAGAQGSGVSQGPSLSDQTVELYGEDGVARPLLSGTWFHEGFVGAMGELLGAIEHGRQPSNAARDNLQSLALCFAALASADAGRPIVPGEVRSCSTPG
ncbi:MAG: Gfo/Idh/MocA family protein [Blastocatellia bacterium]